MSKVIDEVEAPVLDENEIKKLLRNYLKNSSVASINNNSILSDLADSYREQSQEKFANELKLLQDSLKQATGSTKEFVAQSAFNVFFKESNNIFVNIFKTFTNRIFGGQDQRIADLAAANFEQILSSGSNNRTKDEVKQEPDLNLSISKEPGLGQDLKNNEKILPEVPSHEGRSILSTLNTDSVYVSSAISADPEAPELPPRPENILPPLPERNKREESFSPLLPNESPAQGISSQNIVSFESETPQVKESDIPRRNLLDEIAAGIKLKPVNQEALAGPSTDESLASTLSKSPVLEKAKEAVDKLSIDSTEIRPDSEWENNPKQNYKAKKEVPKQAQETQVIDHVANNFNNQKTQTVDEKKQNQNIEQDFETKQNLGNTLRDTLSRRRAHIGGKSKDSKESFVNKIVKNKKNSSKKER